MRAVDGIPRLLQGSSVGYAGLQAVREFSGRARNRGNRKSNAPSSAFPEKRRDDAKSSRHGSVTMDVHSPETRSRNMAAIRATNTKPELLLRRALFALGFRYRLHVASLPGRPDIVMPRRRCAIFVHGCFFHGHDCPSFKWPQTRSEFWRAKIEGNRGRDERNQAALQAMGWQVLTVWECELRGGGGGTLAAAVAGRLAPRLRANTHPHRCQ